MRVVYLNGADSGFDSYSHEAAIAQTGITDSLGSSIHYTLDTLGNWIKDEAKDPLGTLSQQTIRVDDAWIDCRL